MPEQTPPPVKSAAATIRIVVDGVASKHDLQPAAIETLNNFLHASGFTGTFGERFISWMRQTMKALSLNDAYAPEVVRTKRTAAKVAIDAVEAEAVALAEEKR